MMRTASPSPRVTRSIRRRSSICRRSARRCGARNGKILRPTILVALMTLIVVQVITPRYSSESRVFIEGRDNIYLRPDADKIATTAASSTRRR